MQVSGEDESTNLLKYGSPVLVGCNLPRNRQCVASRWMTTFTKPMEALLLGSVTERVVSSSTGDRDDHEQRCSDQSSRLEAARSLHLELGYI